MLSLSLLQARLIDLGMPIKIVEVSRVPLPDCRACHIELGIRFVAQHLCNALGVSGLHWVWAIDAASGPRLRFVRTHRAISSQQASVLDPMTQ